MSDKLTVRIETITSGTTSLKQIPFPVLERVVFELKGVEYYTDVNFPSGTDANTMEFWLAKNNTTARPRDDGDAYGVWSSTINFVTDGKTWVPMTQYVPLYDYWIGGRQFFKMHADTGIDRPSQMVLYYVMRRVPTNIARAVHQQTVDEI